jgi:hypothetical protein
MQLPDGDETTPWEAWASGLIIGLIVCGWLGFLVGHWWT